MPLDPRMEKARGDDLSGILDLKQDEVGRDDQNP